MSGDAIIIALSLLFLIIGLLSVFIPPSPPGRGARGEG